MKQMRSPDMNELGLVLTPINVTKKRNDIPNKNQPLTIDRHHLYWPRQIYNQQELSHNFREHRFNSIWIYRSDHNEIHRQYDGIPIPSNIIMKAFLTEANLLDELDVCVRAIKVLDYLIDNQTPKRLDSVIDRRQRHVADLSSKIIELSEFELLPLEIANVAINNATALIKAA